MDHNRRNLVDQVHRVLELSSVSENPVQATRRALLPLALERWGVVCSCEWEQSAAQAAGSQGAALLCFSQTNPRCA
jgi:hypothetical protein